MNVRNVYSNSSFRYNAVHQIAINIMLCIHNGFMEMLPWGPPNQNWWRCNFEHVNFQIQTENEWKLNVRGRAFSSLQGCLYYLTEKPHLRYLIMLRVQHPKLAFGTSQLFLVNWSESGDWNHIYFNYFLLWHASLTSIIARELSWRDSQSWLLAKTQTDSMATLRAQKRPWQICHYKKISQEIMNKQGWPTQRYRLTTGVNKSERLNTYKFYKLYRLSLTHYWRGPRIWHCVFSLKYFHTQKELRLSCLFFFSFHWISCIHCSYQV